MTFTMLATASQHFVRRSLSSLLPLELLSFTILIILVNLSLLHGSFAQQFVFLPDAVLHGEWWRVILHPWVHVSLYHLVLDGAAFLLLYSEFRDWTMGKRLALTAWCAFGSMLLGVASPLVADHGLCGLSGIAHGLMVVSAVEMYRRGARLEKGMALMAFAGVIAKTAYETVTGQVLFGAWHFGSVGTPITISHAGGILAGLVFVIVTPPRCVCVPGIPTTNGQ